MHIAHQADNLRKEVLIVGVLDRPESTNVHMAKGFEALGYTVVPYNYRTVKEALGSERLMWDDFLEFIENKTFDLILFSKVNGLHPDCLEQAGASGPTWYWFMDPLEIAKSIRASELAARCHYASATSNESKEYIQRQNPNTFLIREGFNPLVYYPRGGEFSKYSCEVAFIGNATSERVAFLREIVRHRHVDIFGSGWPEDLKSHPPVFNEELRKVIHGTKIVLNFVRSNIFSDRVILTMACGGFVLSEYCQDLEDVFVQGEQLDWFASPGEAIEKIEKYLSDESGRKKIAENACKKVTETYSWSNVAENILKIVEDKNVRPHVFAAPTMQCEPGERVLFASWHGLGDNVMLTPALRKFRQAHPGCEVGLLGLRRFGENLTGLLSGLDFIDAIYPVLPDAWNDFASYQEGVDAVKRCAMDFAYARGYDRLVILPTEKLPGYRMHKVFRFAREVGVEYANFAELRTELAVREESVEEVKFFLEQYQPPRLLLHTKAGNPAKNLSPDITEEILTNFPTHTILEFGGKTSTRSIPVPENDMEFSKALVACVDLVIAIDSVVMHIAGALERPCLAIFTVTPVHQAIPLTSPITLVVDNNNLTEMPKWHKYKKIISKTYNNN